MGETMSTESTAVVANLPRPVAAARPRLNRATVILAFLSIYLIWGSTYLAIRFDGITNGEVCGTPDKVNGEKRKDDGSAIQPRARSGNRPGEVCNNCRGFRGHGFTHERQW